MNQKTGATILVDIPLTESEKHEIKQAESILCATLCSATMWTPAVIDGSIWTIEDLQFAMDNIYSENKAVQRAFTTMKTHMTRFSMDALWVTSTHIDLLRKRAE